MVSKTEIQRTLQRLQSSYNGARTNWEKLHSAKLAIIELCGWAEGTQDDIVRTALSKCTRTLTSSKFVEHKIKRNSSFTYEDHFRGMMVGVIGVVGVEKIESALDQQKFVPLKSELRILKEKRDGLAHTHIKGTTQTIDGLSVTIPRFQTLYDGFKDYEAVVRANLP